VSKTFVHPAFRPRLLASAVAAALIAGGATDARAQTEAPEVPNESVAPPAVQPTSPPAPLVPPPAPSVPPPAPSVPLPAVVRDETPPPVRETIAEAPLIVARPEARSPVSDDSISISPGARLDLDGGALDGSGGASASLLVRRARLHVTGAIGPWVSYSAAAEYASPPGARSAVWAPADVFVAVAPLGSLLALQAGQFDAPFSLENRTADDALDFLERSIAVRAFGIPENKATGAMLTGVDDAQHFHYALGVFDGDGPSLRSLDNQFDVMARAWLEPFSFAGPTPLRELSLGGSLWLGDRANALPLDAQATSEGFAFARFEPYTTTVGGAPRQLRQVGRRAEAAVELDAPLAPRYGARGEILWRRSPLSEEDVTDPSRPVILGGANLDGWAAYGEAWFWALGDERSAPGTRHGLEAIGRHAPSSQAPRDGLMLALRISHVDEEVWQETDATLLNLRDPSVGITRVTSYELGVNYWHARAFRATCNYLVNRISGTTPEVRSLGVSTEQELLLRLGITL
jgi:Phosphate-selective porin O and P